MFTVNTFTCVICTVMWILLLADIKDVTGVQMLIQSSIVADGTLSNVTMECSLSQDETRMQVQSFLYLKINYKPTNNTVAIITTGSVPPEIQLSKNFQHRHPAVVVNGTLKTSPNPDVTPHEAGLWLHLDSQAVKCHDFGDYLCEVGYLDQSLLTNTLFSRKASLALNGSDIYCNNSWPSTCGNFMMIMSILTMAKYVIS